MIPKGARAKLEDVKERFELDLEVIQQVLVSCFLASTSATAELLLIGSGRAA